MARPASSRPSCAIIATICEGANGRGMGGFPLYRHRDRRALQAQRLDFRRRGRLPGRSRRRLVDGGGGPRRGARGHERADRERRRNRHGASPRDDLRSGRRARADPLHRAQRFGAVKAIAAASLALHGDGQHRVSLDSVVATMRQTGADMQSKYKETKPRRPRGQFYRVLRGGRQEIWKVLASFNSAANRVKLGVGKAWISLDFSPRSSFFNGLREIFDEKYFVSSSGSLSRRSPACRAVCFPDRPRFSMRYPGTSE